jgi:hypothetical protein
MKNSEEREVVELPDTVWDEYIGQIVCVQLKMDYVSVTAPCTFAQMAPGEFLKLPLAKGLFGVQRDTRGNVRVTLMMNDPDPNRSTLVHTSFDPAAIFAISVTQAEEEKPRIITGS